MRILTLFVFALSCLTPAVGAAEDPPDEPEFACREPGLWMAASGEDEFAGLYCDQCMSRKGDYCIEHVRREARRLLKGPDTRTSEGTTHVNLAVCGEIDYQIQLLRAWHGRGLDDPAWKPYFEERFDWFGDRERASYPRPAPRLIHKLKKLRKACVATEKKYAKYLAPLQRLRRTGRVGRAVPTLHSDVSGMSERVLSWRGNPRSPRWLTLYATPRHVRDYWLKTPEAADEEERKQFHMEGPVADEALEAEVHAVAHVFQNDTIQRVGFTCLGECEGGYSLAVYLDEEGDVVGQSQDFSACPFVYTSPDGTADWALQGEVLRDVRGADAETDQTLAVQHEQALCESGTLWVRLTEEKREITYLDDVALLVAGVEVAPDQCSDALAHCTDDGEYTRLDEGDTLDLRFTIPEDVRGGCNAVEVWADGYYVPVPDR